MNIDHGTLVRAVGLAAQYTRKNRNYRLVLSEFGVQVRGYDRTNLKKFLQFDKTIKWTDLASNVAFDGLERTFAEIDNAIDDQLEGNKSNAETSPKAKA